MTYKGGATSRSGSEREEGADSMRAGGSGPPFPGPCRSSPRHAARTSLAQLHREHLGHINEFLHVLGRDPADWVRVVHRRDAARLQADVRRVRRPVSPPLPPPPTRPTTSLYPPFSPAREKRDASDRLGLESSLEGLVDLDLDLSLGLLLLGARAAGDALRLGETRADSLQG